MLGAALCHLTTRQCSLQRASQLFHVCRDMSTRRCAVCYSDLLSIFRFQMGGIRPALCVLCARSSTSFTWLSISAIQRRLSISCRTLFRYFTTTRTYLQNSGCAITLTSPRSTVPSIMSHQYAYLELPTTTTRSRPSVST